MHQDLCTCESFHFSKVYFEFKGKCLVQFTVKLTGVVPDLLLSTGGRYWLRQSANDTEEEEEGGEEEGGEEEEEEGEEEEEEEAPERV